MNKNKIQLLDVTLRDGEQTRGVSFSAEEKLNIARFLLKNLKVDRVEIASARVSQGEFATVEKITEWARKEKLEKKLEMLGFVDINQSADWICDAGVSTMNLLTKGSLHHLQNQLKKTQKEHLADIEKTIQYSGSKKVAVNIYLEDWSNGFINSPQYVISQVDALSQMGVGKIFLADTLGVLSPQETYAGVAMLVEKHPQIHFEFHGHNDYDLSVANCMEAVRAGVRGIHASVNGLGERAGNTPLEAVVTAFHDKTGVKTAVVEKEITRASRMVEAFSGKRVSGNRAVVGEDVFTQTAGIHADGDKKGNLYANPILPERFGRQRSYALGKLAGKASISENLKQLGMALGPEMEKKVLARVIELGDQNKTVTREDLPYIIADLSGQATDFLLQIVSCSVTSGVGVKPSANLTLQYKNKTYKEIGQGDGGYDAFMDALRKIASQIKIKLPLLSDYEVRIPPGGKTDALVETIIDWMLDVKKEESFRTIGVDSDQLVAAIKATEKMLNLVVKA